MWPHGRRHGAARRPRPFMRPSEDQPFRAARDMISRLLPNGARFFVCLPPVLRHRNRRTRGDNRPTGNAPDLRDLGGIGNAIGGRGLCPRGRACAAAGATAARRRARAGCSRRRNDPRQRRPARARPLSRRDDRRLRQLPHAAPARRHAGRQQEPRRRVRHRRARVQGLRAEHHARHGNRHRLVDRGPDRRRDPQRAAARRHVLGPADVVRLVPQHVGHRRARDREVHESRCRPCATRCRAARSRFR